MGERLNLSQQNMGEKLYPSQPKIGEKLYPSQPKMCEKLYPSQQMLASSVGAGVVALFATPFDLVKVRMQAQLKTKKVKCTVFNELVETICICTNPSYNSPVLCSVHGDLRIVPRFQSSTDAFWKIAKLEGVTNLWKGLPTYLVQMVPQTVIYFTAYDQLKEQFTHKTNVNATMVPVFAGMISRTFASIACSPFELARTKLQSKQNMQYRQLVNIMRTTIKSEGVTCLWKGIGPTLFRDVPFSGIYWLSYETLKSLHDENNFVSSFSSGALAGSIAALLTNPFDVVKTYRQIELGETKTGTVKPRYTFMVMLHLYGTKGPQSLFTGVYPRLMKVSLACAIMISTYELMKKYFTRKNNQLFSEEAFLANEQSINFKRSIFREIPD